MKTGKQTLEALIAYTKFRIRRGHERTIFIRDQMDKAETKAQLALWQRQAERHIGTMGVYEQVLEDLYLFLQQPSALFGSETPDEK